MKPSFEPPRYEWLCLDEVTWHKDNVIEHGLKDGRTCRQTGSRPTREVAR